MNLQINIDKILNYYAGYAAQVPTKKAVIVYDTMWGSTEKMARAIGEGLSSSGVHVEILPLSASHRSDIVTEILDSGAILVGSPTLNNQMFPTISDLLIYLKGLKPMNLIGSAFGSYGWSGEGASHVHSMLTEMKLDVVDSPLKVLFVPDEDTLLECFEFGKKVAEALEKLLLSYVN